MLAAVMFAAQLSSVVVKQRECPPMLSCGWPTLNEQMCRGIGSKNSTALLSRHGTMPDNFAVGFAVDVAVGSVPSCPLVVNIG